MKIEFNAPLNKNNKGIEEILKHCSKKGSASFDFKKGKVSIEDFSNEKMDIILFIIREFFDITFLNLTNDKKFKLRNDEKSLQNKKKQLLEDISKKPSTISSQVKAYILKEKVITLTQLREAFPTTNFGTLRAYVKDLKNDEIIVQIEKGKYSVR